VLAAVGVALGVGVNVAVEVRVGGKVGVFFFGESGQGNGVPLAFLPQSFARTGCGANAAITASNKDPRKRTDSI
jgi:hypothetical protein